MDWINCSIRYGTSKEDKVFEKLILNLPWESYTAQKAYQYAKNILKRRWKEGEQAICSSPHYAYQYAKFVIKDRWPEAESGIMKHPNTAYLYSKYILKRRWPEAEENAKWHTSIGDFYYYCKFVRKSRWVEIEKKIEKDAIKKGWTNVYHIVNYVRFVSKTRWKKMEEHIAKSCHIKEYMSVLTDPSDREDFYNRVLMCALNDSNKYHYNHAKEYVKHHGVVQTN
jgi:hypothetical protein